MKKKKQRQKHNEKIEIPKICFYLAHPYSSRGYIREWELKIEKKTGISLTNPFFDVGDRSYREKLGTNAIVEGDFFAMFDSDGVIGIIDGATSYGTIMELVYARLLGRPVLLIVTNGQTSHPWLKFHSSRMVTDFKAAEKVLQAGMESAEDLEEILEKIFGPKWKEKVGAPDEKRTGKNQKA